MKSTITTLFILLLLSFAAFGQDRSSEVKETYSSVFDIRKFTKVYVLADSEKEHAIITKALEEEKFLEFPEKAKNAQFFIQYKKLPTGDEVRAFYFKEGEIVIVWAENISEKYDIADLVKEFLEAFERNKSIK